MPTNKKWYVTADGARAQIWIEDGTDPRGKLRFQAIASFESENLPSREIMSDRPGRVHDRFGQHRHAAEPRTDPQRHEKARFIHELAGHLQQAFNEQRFEALVLVAPPRVLGDLRAELPSQIYDRVIREETKDLTSLPVADIEHHLRELADASA
jgi:protein required for attachment to host cells